MTRHRKSAVLCGLALAGTVACSSGDNTDLIATDGSTVPSSMTTDAADPTDSSDPTEPPTDRTDLTARSDPTDPTSPTSPGSGNTTAPRQQVPTIGWTLKNETQHSRSLRRHGIWSTSNAKPTATSLTLTQCEIHGNLIKAVGKELNGTASLGPCRVQVSVAETPEWKARTVVLQTNIVEAVVSLAWQNAPPREAYAGDTVTVVVQMAHADASIDTAFAVNIGGCGADGANLMVGAGRRVSHTFQIPDKLAGKACELSASTTTRGTVHVVGRGSISGTITVKRRPLS